MSFRTLFCITTLKLVDLYEESVIARQRLCGYCNEPMERSNRGRTPGADKDNAAASHRELAHLQQTILVAGYPIEGKSARSPLTNRFFIGAAPARKSGMVLTATLLETRTK